MDFEDWLEELSDNKNQEQEQDLEDDEDWIFLN